MKLWIDVTDFMGWKGNFTGFQRIQYNIAKEYLKSGRDVGFFVYDEKSRLFQEVEFNPDKVARNGLVVGGITNSMPDRVNKLYLKLKTMLPSSIKNRIKKVIRSTPRPVTVKEGYIFGPDDSVLVLGGIWFGNFITDLGRLKKATGFKLFHFIHDMIPALFPGYVVEGLPEAFSGYKKVVFSIADGLIANSQSTACDAKRFMQENGIKQPPLDVVRIGEKVNTGDNGSEKSLLGKTGSNFILSVSTVEARKNHASFFYVVKEAKKRGIELPKIVIVGRNGWLTDNIRYIVKNDPDAIKNIVLLNDVDDRELSWLYKNCLFTVFPSFYEGWGMPVAESLTYGKLCLSADTSSMPEIAGDLIDYFSPYDTGAMLDCIVKNLDPIIRQKKERRIKSEYHPTSWFSMYEEIDNFISGRHK